MVYKIREMSPKEYYLLDDFLYEAIYIPNGVEAPPKTVINIPELQVYVSNFGKQPDDKALVVEVNNKIVGACWVRIMNDYGHVDNNTPSFSIALYSEYRCLGIGTNLMIKMLDWLKESGYKKASLSVQKENYAVKMYEKLGFETIKETDEEYIMLKCF